VPDDDKIDQSYKAPAAPTADKPWPRPTRTVYPMKPSDLLLEDGLLYSGGLGRTKLMQHEHRVILKWQGDKWAVVRPRLRVLQLPTEAAAGPSEFYAPAQGGSTCPQCGSQELIPIVYGMPGSDRMAAAERNEIALGGCVVSDHDPTHRCSSCGHDVIL
jgi:hypothetical protein